MTSLRIRQPGICGETLHGSRGEANFHMPALRKYCLFEARDCMYCDGEHLAWHLGIYELNIVSGLFIYIN